MGLLKEQTLPAARQSGSKLRALQTLRASRHAVYAEASRFEGATEPRGSVWSARSLLPLWRGTIINLTEAPYARCGSHHENEIVSWSLGVLSLGFFWDLRRDLAFGIFPTTPPPSVG